MHRAQQNTLRPDKPELVEADISTEAGVDTLHKLIRGHNSKMNLMGNTTPSNENWPMNWHFHSSFNEANFRI